MTRTRWRWTHWASFGTSDLLVPIAAAIVAMTVIAVWRGLVLRPFGGPGFTPVLPASLLFAALVGRRALGLVRPHLDAWRRPLAILLVMLGGLLALYAWRVGTAVEAGSFVIGALEEELVFRLALPLAVGGVVAGMLGRPPTTVANWGRLPRAAALVSAGLAFVLMPGHLEQMGSALAAIPFAAIALLFTYIVLRTGDIGPGVLAHAALNLATVCFLAEVISRPVWSLAVVVLLATYALGAERAGRRLGYLVDVSSQPQPASTSAPSLPSGTASA